MSNDKGRPYMPGERYRYSHQRIGRPKKGPVERFDGFCAQQMSRIHTTLARFDEHRRKQLRALYQEEDWDPSTGIGAASLLCREDLDAEERS